MALWICLFVCGRELCERIWWHCGFFVLANCVKEFGDFVDFFCGRELGSCVKEFGGIVGLLFLTNRGKKFGDIVVLFLFVARNLR